MDKLKENDNNKEEKVASSVPKVVDINEKAIDSTGNSNAKEGGEENDTVEQKDDEKDGNEKKNNSHKKSEVVDEQCNDNTEKPKEPEDDKKSNSGKSDDIATNDNDNKLVAKSDKVNEKSTNYNVSVFKFLQKDKKLEVKDKQFKVFQELHTKGIKHFLHYEKKAKEAGDKTYMKMKSPDCCNYSIYNHCNCENLIAHPYVQCNETGCKNKMHKMCFYKMYSVYFPWTKQNGMKLLDTEDSDIKDFRFSFPIHKKIKKLEIGPIIVLIIWECIPVHFTKLMLYMVQILQLTSIRSFHQKKSPLLLTKYMVFIRIALLKNTERP